MQIEGNVTRSRQVNWKQPHSLTLPPAPLLSLGEEFSVLEITRGGENHPVTCYIWYFNITNAIFGLSFILVFLGCLVVNLLRPYCLLKMCPKCLVTVTQSKEVSYKLSKQASHFSLVVIESENVHMCVSETVNLSRSGIVRFYEIIQNHHFK